MGRRYISLIVLALAVGFGVRMTLAQAEAPASPPPAEALPVPDEVPPPMNMPLGAELPPPAVGAPGAAGELLPPAADAGATDGPSAQSSPGQEPGVGKGLAAPAADSSPTEGTGAPPPKKNSQGPAPGDGGMPAAPAQGNPPPGALDPGAPLSFPPAGAALPSEQPAPSVDPDIERSQAPVAASPSGAAVDTNPLPPAQEPAGQSASIAPNEADELVLSPERLRNGSQSIGLTVEVKGPPTLNLKTPATYKIIVSNPGTADATGVVVRDALPAELEFVSSQPTEQRGPDTLLAWNLGTVRAGSQQVITLKVKPIRKGRFDHAATVSMRAGAKSSTQVYEPKLKVVQAIRTDKVLKGQQVESRITVSNTGDGIARDVVVQAKLSPGLRAGAVDSSSEQNLFELDLGDLGPGEQVELNPLVADAILGGEQWCQVEAKSPDVAPGAEEAKSKQVVTVVEPKLAMTLVGPKNRYTDTVATYKLTVVNPGTATARNVRVAVTLPVSGRLIELPTGARFDSSTRRLVWDPFSLEPGEKDKVELNFEVRMGGPSLYQVTAQAVGEQNLAANQMTSTDVIPLADLDVRITEDRRVVDVGQLTTFTIRIKNKGSKAATQILLRARHSPELIVKRTAGTEEAARYKQDAAGKPIDGEFYFPLIPRLDQGKEIELGVQVQALKVGLATCRIYVTHEDIEQPVEAMESLRVTQAVGQ